ncbi:flavin-containing monooxygenase [Pseudonocardia sp. Cha107L01]|jgi:cation diffusion facilitator CzcD-associated flavoprotein CzcO|uniref:flavin-containing monooxygenase n=1 Tax=Pseudonocardia sp. Cha107L01 TaxID=3457576 RepID=UPI00403EA019
MVKNVDGTVNQSAQLTQDVEVIVIGAGFAGLYAIHHLRNERGLDVQAFDSAGGVGGVWYWNRYPGARSDVEVHAYCFSFDKDLYRDWKWSERYPHQPELLAYLEHVADRFDLRRSIQFDTTVRSAHFNEETNRWIVGTSDGELWSAQFLIEGIGLLSSVNYPAIPGLDSFAGKKVLHRALAPDRPRPEGQARRYRRHWVQRVPGHHRDRTGRVEPVGVPTHTAVRRASPARPDRSRPD